MKHALRFLAALGIVAQALALLATWGEIAPMLRGDRNLDVVGPALLFLPLLLGVGGAAWAARLHSHGSAWAWVVMGVPLVLLGLALCLAVLFWLEPIRH